MKNFCFVVLFAFVCAETAFCQQWTWGMKATGSQQRYGIAELAVNDRGDMVMAGHYQENLSIGPFSLPIADDYYSSIYLCRINAEKEVQWVHPVGSGNGSYGDDIGLAIDDDENIYLTGTDNSHIFAAKYDSTGKEIWFNNLESKYYGYGYSISVDQFDYVYISGGDGWNFFMTKLDSNGNVIWTKDIWVNYSNGCYITDIEVDALGNIYFVGTFGIDVLPLDQFELQHDEGWGNNLVFGKMNSAGDFVWVKSAQGYLTDSPKLALTSDNHLYIGGGFSAWLVFPENYIQGACCNEAAPFIGKFKTDGTYVWAKVGESYNGTGIIVDIKADHTGNIYTTGRFFTCYGTFCTEGDYYVEKYDTNGQNKWRHVFAMAGGDIPNAIDIDNNGFLYLTGTNESKNFIDANQYSDLSTLGVGQFNTEASTFKRTKRPRIDSHYTKCEQNETVRLTATGQNINWYSDAAAEQKISSGNTFSGSFTTTDTLFVTQSINGIESWPKPVIVLSEIPDTDLILRNDSLLGPQGDHYKYQWYYQNDSIPNATDFFAKVDTTSNYENFDLVIAQGKCVKVFNQIMGITSIDPDDQRLRVSCYPNPTTGRVSISIKTKSPFIVTGLNSMGKEILTKEFLPSNGGNYSLTLEDQAQGIYYIKVSGKQLHKVFKILKK